MSYASMIGKGLEKAFIKLKDLAVKGAFTRKPNAAFDFTTASLEEGLPLNFEADVIIVDEKRVGTTVEAELLFKSAEVGAPDLLDSVLINGRNFKIGSVLAAHRFATVVKAYEDTAR